MDKLKTTIKQDKPKKDVKVRETNRRVPTYSGSSTCSTSTFIRSLMNFV